MLDKVIHESGDQIKFTGDIWLVHCMANPKVIELERVQGKVDHWGVQLGDSCDPVSVRQFKNWERVEEDFNNTTI